MYNIFFNKRVLAICKSNSDIKQPDAAYLYATGGCLPEGIPDFFEKSENIGTLAIITEREDEIFEKICSGFKEIYAAGGLVHNEKEEYLLILRNGVWDLPKGKAEEGESMETTAVREVHEECGLQRIGLGEPICITRHCYRLGDDFILKHTHWFRMECSSAEKLVPQSEEGIEQIKWVAKKELGKYAGLTYPSLREVLAAAEYSG